MKDKTIEVFFWSLHNFQDFSDKITIHVVNPSIHTKALVQYARR